MRMNHTTNEIFIIRPQDDAPNVQVMMNRPLLSMHIPYVRYWYWNVLQVFDGTSGKKKRQFDIKIPKFWQFVVMNNTIFALSLDPAAASPIYLFDCEKGDLIRQLALPVEEGVKRTAMACIKQTDEKDEKTGRDPLVIVATTNRIYVTNRNHIIS